jgi:hypothetical protein
MLLGKLGARFVMGVVQMLVLFTWGHFVFHVLAGLAVLAFFILTLAVVSSASRSGPASRPPASRPSR